MRRPKRSPPRSMRASQYRLLPRGATRSIACCFIAPSRLTAFDGAVWKRLEHHLANGTVGALGVSVQSPTEALSALDPSQRPPPPASVQHPRLALGRSRCDRSDPQQAVRDRSRAQRFSPGRACVGRSRPSGRASKASMPRALISWLDEMVGEIRTPERRRSVSRLCARPGLDRWRRHRHGNRGAA